jgi:hypothetical protein
MRRGWLELLEPIGIVAGAFCVGWVLAGQQGGAQSPPWGLWAVGPPVIAGAFWEPKLPSLLVVLFHTLVTRISLGLWALLAGWSVAGALSDFPWPVALHLVPLIVGLHVPLALTWDRWPSSQRRLLRHLGYDRAAGLRTVAVALGTGPAKKLGWALWLLYLFGLMGASALGYGLPRTLLPLVLGLSPLFVGQYARVLWAAGEPRACWRRVVELCALWHVLVLGLAILYAAS